MKDIADIRKLPVTERLQLVGEIWDSILEDPDLLPVSEELIHDLEQRLAGYRRDPGSVITWEDLDREVFGSD
jgi:putative addiction module component (TIGR02574 family)